MNATNRLWPASVCMTHHLISCRWRHHAIFITSFTTQYETKVLPVGGAITYRSLNVVHFKTNSTIYWKLVYIFSLTICQLKFCKKMWFTQGTWYSTTKRWCRGRNHYGYEIRLDPRSVSQMFIKYLGCNVVPTIELGRRTGWHYWRHYTRFNNNGCHRYNVAINVSNQYEWCD